MGDGPIEYPVSRPPERGNALVGASSVSKNDHSTIVEVAKVGARNLSHFPIPLAPRRGILLAGPGGGLG